jgi:hypothetical protein
MKINFTRGVIQKTNILVYLFFICSTIVAQTGDTTKLKSPEIFAPQKLNLLPFSTDLQSNFMHNQSFQNPATRLNKIFFLKESTSFKKISFDQNKLENNFPGLGSYEFFNNSLNYRINNNTKIDIGVGLARQNSILYAAKPNYQIGFQASVEFAVTPKLDAFIYGQYFTSPINKPKDFFDPMIYRNPLFLQSEVGTGIKRDYKNINAKFQINSIYDNNNRQFTPVNSKISIGF